MQVNGASAWTGGQYSLYRAVLGSFLLVYFTRIFTSNAQWLAGGGASTDGPAAPLLQYFPNILAVTDGPMVVRTMLAVAVVSSIALIVGWMDRPAALVLCYILACLGDPAILFTSPSLPILGGLLLSHIALPAAPFGSVTAIGRTDPSGGWQMRWSIWGTMWVVTSLGYAYIGYSQWMTPSWVDGSAFGILLNHPDASDTALRDWLLRQPTAAHQYTTWIAMAAATLFAPLALFRKTRALAWTSMIVVHLAALSLLQFADLAMSVFLLHLFLFDPAWLSRPVQEQPRLVFYDGDCGLCHRAIRLLLAEDPHGVRFRFAPLQGETFAQRVPEDVRSQLPDSLVVVNPDAKLRVKGEAAQVLLADLGGLWRGIGLLLQVLPSRLQDLLYDLVAGNRTKLFGTVNEACPMMTPEQRGRFLH